MSNLAAQFISSPYPTRENTKLRETTPWSSINCRFSRNTSLSTRWRIATHRYIPTCNDKFQRQGTSRYVHSGAAEPSVAEVKLEATLLQGELQQRKFCHAEKFRPMNHCRGTRISFAHLRGILQPSVTLLLWCCPKNLCCRSNCSHSSFELGDRDRGSADPHQHHGKLKLELFLRISHSQGSHPSIHLMCCTKSDRWRKSVIHPTVP